LQEIFEDQAREIKVKVAGIGWVSEELLALYRKKPAFLDELSRIE